MLTRKRFSLPIVTGDWGIDGPRLLKALNDYLLSLEGKEALTITEATINSSTIGATSATTGKFTTLESTVSTGTAPLTVASTTKVSNLNADLLDGADWVAPGTIGSTTPNTGKFTTLESTGNTTLGDASTDTLNVGNGGIVKDSSGNVGIGTGTPSKKLVVSNAGEEGFEIQPGVDVPGSVRHINYNRSTASYIGGRYEASTHTWLIGATERMVITADGRLYGTALHNNAGAITGTTNQYIASKTYTPGALTNTTNVASSTMRQCTMGRLGNKVTVSGQFEAAATAANSLCLASFELPIASNFTTVYQAGGNGSYNPGGGATFEGVSIMAQVTDDRLQFSWTPSVTGTVTITFDAGYEIV